jgi:hypothetical protein
MAPVVLLAQAEQQALAVLLAQTVRLAQTVLAVQLAQVALQVLVDKQEQAEQVETHWLYLAMLTIFLNIQQVAALMKVLPINQEFTLLYQDL